MTRYWIEFPPEAALFDQRTHEPARDESGRPARLDGAEFLGRLWDNPLWNRGYKEGSAQAIIIAAHAESPEGFWLDEEPFKLLREACEKPCCQFGQQVFPGIGFNPRFASQVAPFFASVLEAPTEAQKKRAESAAAEAVKTKPKMAEEAA